jgi:hypothetical protein
VTKLRHIFNRTRLLLVILIVGLNASVSAIAAMEKPISIAGQVVFAVGDAYVVSPSGPEKATKGAMVMAGDRLVTGVQGYIHLRMADGAFLGIRSNSLLEINEYMFDTTRPENGRVRMFLQEGTVRAISGRIAHSNKYNFRLNTPLAAIGVRGTDFVTAADQWNTQVAVASGGIAMAPYSSECVILDLGPCLGKDVTDLYAKQKDALLVVRRGQTTAQVINSDLESQFEPAHPQEKHDVSRVTNATSEATNAANSNVADVLTFVLQQSLTVQEIKALDLQPNDASPIKQELVQIDSLELMRFANAVGDQPAYRQRLDRKVVNIEDKLFNIVTESEPLLRFFDVTGMLAWSASANADKFDERIAYMQKGQSYQSLMERIGLGTYLQGFGMDSAQADGAINAWEIYYGDTVQGPIAQLGDSNLYYAAGLKDLQVPSLNRYFPAVNLAYKNNNARILSTSGGFVVDQVALKINHSNGVFEATIAINDLVNGPQEYRVTGSLNTSGMVFGGNERASLEGFSITGTEQIATIFHYSNGVTTGDALLLFDDAALSWPETAIAATPALYKVDDNALVNWGRWEHYAPLDDQVIERLQIASLDLVAKNSHFALFQPVTAAHEMPVGDAFSFELESYEALHVDSTGTTTATLTDAVLNVDFSTAQFTTHMNAIAPRLPAPVYLFASGGLNDLGQLVAQSQSSNIDLSGIVTNNAQGVGMILEHQIDNRSSIVAATQWVRQ